MTKQEKLNLVTNYFSEDWAITKAMNLLEDYQKMLEAQPTAPHGVVYAELPAGSAWCGAADVRDFGTGPGESALMFAPTRTQNIPLFTADQMHYFADATHALRASNGQAPAGATLPAGWVPLVITHEGQYPEEVAYGPQILMDRLGKWLRKYFDSVVALKPGDCNVVDPRGVREKALAARKQGDKP